LDIKISSTKVENPKATVYFHHGLGDHCERYVEVFEQFNKHQIQVHAFDCRGHGQSIQLNPKAIEGHMGAWERQMKDLEIFIESKSSKGSKILVLMTKRCHFATQLDGD
jgi:alpha-beta hydrolase superfamily lysophospholipase